MAASADLLIKNGRVVTQSHIFEGAVAVKDEKIFSITSNEAAPPADKVINASGLYVLPGIIDVHVHLRDPGFTYKEDFGTGTAAAAAGGVTLVFDMPNNSPPIKDVNALSLKIKGVGQKALVDYSLYGLVTGGSLQEMPLLAKAGVIGFKCYMGETTGKILPPSDGEMVDQFIEASKLDMRVATHAENDSILQYRIEKLKFEGRTDAHAHLESRPSLVEEEAVKRALLYARRSSEKKCKIHVTHLSSESGVEAISEARLRSDPVTADTCPHYLLLDESHYSKLGSLMKINPAIKSAADRASLWTAIRSGTIDMISTDHSPHTLEEKTRSNIFDCASGFPGLETSVPLMLTEVNKGMISLTQYVKLTSANPAKAWGIYPAKGSLQIGSDADLTIVDMKARSKINAEKFYTKAKWSPFDGFEVEGLPLYTIVRGQIVMEKGVVDTKTARGKMITPCNTTN